MIKLCYKSYPFKISQGACKAFSDLTGLDLPTVFQKYIFAYSGCSDNGQLQKLLTLGDLYPRDIANKALHCLIVAEDSSIPFEEIEDATFRVSWMPSDRSDDKSEPWVLVMVDVAMQINKYMDDNFPKKKEVT